MAGTTFLAVYFTSGFFLGADFSSDSESETAAFFFDLTTSFSDSDSETTGFFLTLTTSFSDSELSSLASLVGVLLALVDFSTILAGLGLTSSSDFSESEEDLRADFGDDFGSDLVGDFGAGFLSRVFYEAFLSSLLISFFDLSDLSTISALSSFLASIFLDFFSGFF